MIRYLDLGFQYKQIAKNLKMDLDEILTSGNYILGQWVEKFEKEFAVYSGARYGIGVANGSDALRLSLQSLDLNNKSEVIVPAHTFKASVISIASLGLTPVLVDVNPSTGLMDMEAALTLINSKTKAIMPVHMHGSPVCLCGLHQKLRDLDIYLIEDASQAHGATDHGKKVGSLGDIGCFSLYPGKNLGAAGDAGIVLTSSKNLVERMALLRNWGDLENNDMRSLGWNSRLDEIQALILVHKLSLLNDWNSVRQEQAFFYREAFKNKIKFFDHINGSVYHHFVVLLQNRDFVKAKLKENGIQTVCHYPNPISSQKVMEFCLAPLGTKNADRISQQTLSLPIGPHLSFDDIEKVSEEIIRFASA